MAGPHAYRSDGVTGMSEQRARKSRLGNWVSEIIESVYEGVSEAAGFSTCCPVPPSPACPLPPSLCVTLCLAGC